MGIESINLNGVGLAIVMLSVLGAYFWLPKLAEPTAFTKGYDYALAELRKGTKTPFDLEAEAMGFDDRNDFDVGIDAAVHDMVRAGYVKDNRMYA